MNDELKIIVGANVANFTDGVLKVVKSIGELEAELKQFQKDIKTLKGDEFNAMAEKIGNLKNTISALKSIGSSTLPKLGEDAAKAAAGIDKLAKPAGNAGYALSTMSGVVRDLPFGFIAIQNNLPLMVDSFSNLTKTSGGVGGALKGLGKAMIGPAGIGFAFGAVTSIVTGLIQNYGSLGNAIDVIFAKNKQAAEATASYNKELEKSQGTIGAELVTIDLLVKKLTDLKTPYEDRQAAYDQLKKIQPDILAGLTAENILSGDAITLLTKNAEAQKALILLKSKQNAINKVLDETQLPIIKNEKIISDEKLKQIELDAKILKLKQEREKDRPGVVVGGSMTGIATGGISNVSEIDKLTGALVESKKIQKEAQIETDKYQKIQNEWSGILDPVLTGISNINSATQKSIQTSKDDEAAKLKQIQAAKDLAAANKEVQLSVEQLAAAQIAKALKESQVKQLVEREAMKGTPQTNFDRQVVSAGDTAGAVTSFQGSPIAQGLLDEAAAAAAARTEYEKYAESVSTLVAPAIDQLFTAFEQGKNIFQALGDTIKSLVIDIAKAIIKATILKAITTAVSAGSGAGIFSGLFNLLGGGLGGVAAPSFGGGASLGGGLALNGQVVFVQRGTDLVGVLNKGNSQINRVG